MVDGKNFLARYSHIHPLIFHRSCAYAKTPGDLFDILESIPEKYPIVWNEKVRQWVFVENMHDLHKCLGIMET